MTCFFRIPPSSKESAHLDPQGRQTPPRPYVNRIVEVGHAVQVEWGYKRDKWSVTATFRPAKAAMRSATRLRSHEIRKRHGNQSTSEGLSRASSRAARSDSSLWVFSKRSGVTALVTVCNLEIR